MGRWRPLLWLCASAALLGGCSTVAYYGQAVRGQLGVMAASRPIDEVLQDPAVAPPVRERLRQVPEVRRFAVDELALPANDSYRSYAELQRPAMVWSLVAAPFDSLQPRQWCYPVVGCASYRGYFDRRAAERYAAELAAEGWDVAVQPVPAYSTLGWFDDPLPSTVIAWPLANIAGLLFHELAHQALYVPGDSAFNEAYATVVEREGVRRWLDRHGSAAEIAAWNRHAQRRGEFLRLLAAARERLQALYATPQDRDTLAAAKTAEFDSLRAGYRKLRARWGGFDGYDRWFVTPLNNAHLASLATYHELEPAFRAILAEVNGDMAAFHRACRAIAELPPAMRARQLQDGLAKAAPAMVSAD